MKTPTFNHLTDAQFKRGLGISRTLFTELWPHLLTFKYERGRPCKLSVESQLTLSLTYWRDYPSLLTLGTQYGISETSAWRVVRRVEDSLIRSGLLSLPKAPSGSGAEEPVVTIVDATEIPIERPKKDSSAGTVVNNKATPLKFKSR